MKSLEEVYTEGLMDRLKARGAGVGAGAKTLVGNIGQNLKKAWTGGPTTQQTGVVEAANKAKLQSIVKTFQKEMDTLFGRGWEQTHQGLAKELSNVMNTQQPAQTTPSNTQQVSQAEQPQNTQQQPASTNEFGLTSNMNDAQKAAALAKIPREKYTPKADQARVQSLMLQKKLKQTKSPQNKKVIQQQLNNANSRTVNHLLRKENFDYVYQNLNDVEKI